MLETLGQINTAVNNFVWGVPAMSIIIGVGLLLTFRTRFLQFRKFGYAFKVTVGKIFHKSESEHGAITPFQAVCTALAATVGTGNIAGVAGAITIGGPGAIFWMWMSALLGMCTKFAEVTLAVHFREKNENGDWVGGPMYYIKNGLGPKWHWLAVLFSLFGILAVFGTGNATQVNTIVTAINSALLNFHLIKPSFIPTLNLILGCVIAIVVALILIGGIQRIGQVTEKLVPGMALLYLGLSLGVIIINYKAIPGVFHQIFTCAFSPSAMTGGIIGSMFLGMKKGISRGIFSNEAGMGTASIAHAAADTKSPVDQGFFGVFEVFTTSMIICTMTALVILCSGIPVPYGVEAGAELTIHGFTSTYGSWVSIFTAVALCCFCLLYHHRMGTLRHKMSGILNGNRIPSSFPHHLFFSRCTWSNHGSWLPLELCRDLQRPHGNTKPDCPYAAFKDCGKISKTISKLTRIYKDTKREKSIRNDGFFSFNFSL